MKCEQLLMSAFQPFAPKLRERLAARNKARLPLESRHGLVSVLAPLAINVYN